MTVLFLAMTPTRAGSVTAQAEESLRRGHRVVLVTAQAAVWEDAGIDPRVLVLALEDAGAPAPAPARVASSVLRLPGRAVGLLTRRPGPLVEPSRRLRRRVDRLAAAADRRVVRGPVAILRPWSLWRKARRRVLTRLDLADVDQVVVADAHAVPLGWRLAQRHPDLPVLFALDPSRLPGERGGGP